MPSETIHLPKCHASSEKNQTIIENQVIEINTYKHTFSEHFPKYCKEGQISIRFFAEALYIMQNLIIYNTVNSLIT